jgi:ABC-type amino acid transport substrate-binding protein
VFHEADSPGIKSGNGLGKGMTAHVISGTADIAVSGFYVTKERSEVVAYTDTLGFAR